jgi:hypothetical protein
MYAAKFRKKTAAAVFKIGGSDLGKPIGNRAKSAIGVDESGVPKDTLVGIKFSKYHKIPECIGNKISANWKPEYLKSLDDSKDSEELVTKIMAGWII